MKKTVCLLAALTLSLTLLSCSQLNERIAIREGNEAYEAEQYAVALQKYQAARSIGASEFADLDRLIGYSYIGLYKPDDDSPQNQKYADAAITELQRYLIKRPTDTAAREAMVNLMLNADRTDQAIEYFKDYLRRHPADLSTVRSIATLYAKKGDFNESLNWYYKITLLDSKNAEAFYTFGVVCYEKVAKNPPADMAERLMILERGKSALTEAMKLRKDYFEAVVYLNLLYREHAKITPDPVQQQALLARADELRNQAVAIGKARKAAEEAAAKK
jgi:predicted Zn-dependent protease